MRKNAFTLIELLAVIVILAIIALIAVPIVIHIINDTKNSSGEEAVKLYIDSVKKAISRKQLEDTSFNPTECTIKDNGNLLCNDIEVTIDMRGIKPNKGIIELKDNKVTYKNLLLNGTYYNRLATPVQDNNNNGKPDIGDKYTYKVNETDKFNFYVLSFNEDNTVNLIMDRNICNDGTVNYTSENNYCSCSWTPNNANNYGPDSSMTYLYESTKSWINIPDMIMNYRDENNETATDRGYTSIITNLETKLTTITPKQNRTSSKQKFGNLNEPLKARLPMEKELKDAGCKTNDGSCPIWLVTNMTYYNVSNDKYSINNNNEEYQNQIKGYWGLASYPNYSTNGRSITYTGKLFQSGKGYGVRPVITVPISDLSN